MKKILTLILFVVTLSIFAGQLKNTEDGQKKKKAQSVQQMTKKTGTKDANYETGNNNMFIYYYKEPSVCHVRYNKNGKTCDGTGYGDNPRQACRRARRDARHNCH